VYLRWKQTRLNDAAALRAWESLPRRDPTAPRYSHRAQLVESKRVDGKVTQRVIAHLGTYQDDHRDDPRQRQRFWCDVRAALDQLERDAAFRQQVEAAIAAKMPPATDEECRREQILHRRWLYLATWERDRLDYWEWREEQE
jgi:hypothetical protein